MNGFYRRFESFFAPIVVFAHFSLAHSVEYIISDIAGISQIKNLQFLLYHLTLNNFTITAKFFLAVLAYLSYRFIEVGRIFLLI